MKLFKDDHQRAIDHVIDYFGYPSAGRDMCGELTLELLSRDGELLGVWDETTAQAPDDREMWRELAYLS